MAALIVVVMVVGVFLLFSIFSLSLSLDPDLNMKLFRKDFFFFPQL